MSKVSHGRDMMWISGAVKRALQDSWPRCELKYDPGWGIFARNTTLKREMTAIMRRKDREALTDRGSEMVKCIVTGAILSFGIGTAAQAGIIDRACMSSDRREASPSLCSCIQQAADMTLSRSDQRKAAKFFRDPQRAQDVRQASDGDRHDFWDRYKSFGDTAAAVCSARG